ncbi:Vacuolar protein sorting-associated protein 52 [Pleurotus ostreatus]|nr:Vacuolar protein sorting-associated protein 52 [Pleurotus ostreatus]
MPSSTLSDALNEFAAHGRSRQNESHIGAFPQGQIFSPQAQEYPRPVHTEGELVLSEPSPPPAQPLAPRKASTPGVHAVQELLRIVAATKEAQEIERRRRLAWEQEQESKFIQRQAEMERQMFEMRQQIASLQAMVHPSPSPNVVHQTPVDTPRPTLLLETPVHHSVLSTAHYQPSSMTSQESLVPNQMESHGNGSITPPEDVRYSTTPSTSPQLRAAINTASPRAKSVDRRKRHTPRHAPAYAEDDSAESSGSDSSSSSMDRPAKRANHHDTRCLTIHHAMRLHLVRTMGLDSDKHLPDSHIEGTALESTDPVRFVWAKTTKQSAHNYRMKERVINDLKDNRKYYKHVPDKDFSKKVLDSVFDQCFTTFRQKYKTQNDESAALAARKRDDMKALKVRRLARRKAKLSARAEARMRHADLEHITFDGAFQLECMSSEESEFEDGQPQPTRFRTRGFAWRSTRLQRLYEILDEEDRETSATKPKRGLGRKDRIVGPVKSELILPPAGSSSWMISKHWISVTLQKHRDLLDVIKKLVVDPPGFDWDRFHELGEDSDAEYQASPQNMDNPVAHTSNQYYTVAADPTSEGEGMAGASYIGRTSDFIDLHDQVQTSVQLLDSLESFLSTFQKDLSVVAGQISELQDRSKDIGNRLKSRKRIEKPLSHLISDIVVPPPLATLILDTDVGEPWIPAIQDFEKKLETIKARSRVKAARDLMEVVEGLRIVAATKLRAFFLALFQPIRSSVTTNMQVMQTSVLLKYRPLLPFLQRQAPNVFQEVQRSYIGAARTYYETGFRRYIRSLTSINTRVIEKPELITVSEKETITDVDMARLEYAKVDGPNITLAYMADDKNHKEPAEAMFRSLMLVLMDNATAEYTFITSFFANEPLPTPADSETPLLSPTALLSPDGSISFDNRSIAASEHELRRSSSTSQGITAALANSKAEQAGFDALWKQVFDPVSEYTQAFVRSIIEPPPPVVPLLVMIRLTEAVLNEIQNRSCPPLESFVFAIRLQMWPVFQKLMTENIDSLKKYAEGTSLSYFARAASTTDASVISICKRYIVIFNLFVALTEQPDETMIFSNLLRLRQEVAKLILRHAQQIKDPAGSAKMRSRLYDGLLQGFTGAHFIAHPKAQQETAYWANLGEESKRKIVSVSQARSRQ